MPSVIVDFELQKLIDEGAVSAEHPIETSQIQPNSLDLRVGRYGKRIQASFVPVGKTVQEALSGNLATYEIDFGGPDGWVLEPQVIYLVEIKEFFRLPKGVRGRVNPKSSTGRLDIFCRAVTDDALAFDEIKDGYEGPLYLEIVPQSFPIRLREGDRLSQVRLSNGDPTLSDDEIRIELGNDLKLWKEMPNGDISQLNRDEARVDRGVLFGVNLDVGKNRTLGFRAKTNLDPIDLQAVGKHAARRYWDREFWEAGSRGFVMLDQGAFYIFASYELISLGPSVCAEMLPYDAGMGEVRSHYAGFFDSGFGWGAGNASRIVLEVRNYHVRYRLFHGQSLFKVVIMRNSSSPRMLYGSAQRPSNYQRQGLRLAKQFQFNPVAEIYGDDERSGSHSLQVPLF